MPDFSFQYQGLLGTIVDLRIGADDEPAADSAAAVVAAEMRRLETIFTSYDEESELCLWRRGELSAISSEFAEVMDQALQWQLRSGGLFNPLVGQLETHWRNAALEGTSPQRELLAEKAARIARPCFEMRSGGPVALRGEDCRALNLNAIAKGYIVDRALGAATAEGLTSVLINAGGDLAHRGEGSIRVGIENPLRPFDNEPPLAVVQLVDGAVATSGVARRGFEVGGTRFGHILDPRTGWPVDHIASATVVAPNAMTADVVATVVAVMEPTEAIRFLEGLDNVEGMIVDRDGRQSATAGWSRLLVTGG